MAYSESSTTTTTSTGGSLYLIYTIPTVITRAIDYLLYPFAVLFSLVMTTQPPDHRASLALDRLGRVDVGSISMSTIASQFKSFLSRALLHDRFDGERFDPGRMPA